jgi:hypothetical protein
VRLPAPHPRRPAHHAARHGFFPHALYNLLPLAVYLDRPLPWLTTVSSADRPRLKWGADPTCFSQGCFLPCQPTPGGFGNRWPCSSSYTAGPAFYDQSPPGQRISQNAEGYNMYIVSPQTTLSGVQLSRVAHPSQKVAYAPQNAWHFGARQPFCTHDQARLPLLMVDGGAPVRSAAESNNGWDPNSTSPTAYVSLSYFPTNCWDPPPINPTGDFVKGRFRYTRNGILGRDFGGPETP